LRLNITDHWPGPYSEL